MRLIIHNGWNEQISTLSQDTIVLISGTKEVEILPNEEMKIDKRQKLFFFFIQESAWKFAEKGE